jgi:2-hydroxy-3-keto-5-methylthiopentenyl-1-phosphate phosphatase
MPSARDPKAALRDAGALRPAPAAAAPIPSLRPGQPPLALLIDYDGTISQIDVSDKILYSLLGESYAQEDAAYTGGLTGSRTLFSNQVKLLPADPGTVIAIAEAQPHDPTFARFVRRAIELEVPVEVVSDGFGFFIEPALQRLGVPGIPIVTNRTTFGHGRARMDFPNGHPDCFVCGTCKRQRVLAHQAAGRTVAFVGDGESDRYGAAYSDLIFAKDELVELCRREGWAYVPWQDFAGLLEWLEATVAAWRADPASLPAHTPRPFMCGPEVWGHGRSDPPRRDAASAPDGR